MIDWVSALIPVIHKPFRGGIISSTTPDGELEWAVIKGTHVRGSHESNIFIRSQGSDGNGNATHIFVDGNPSKFLQGHNILGSDDLRYLMVALIARLPVPFSVQEQLDVMQGFYDLKRIDINYMYELETLQQVEAWLHASQQTMLSRHGKASAVRGTTYLGKGSKRWVIKFYSKFNEAKNGKKSHKLHPEFVEKGFLDWTKNKLRAELMLRTEELKKLGLTRGSRWCLETPFTLFNMYIGKIEMKQNTLLPDSKLIELPRAVGSSYTLWSQGADLRSVLPDRTFYRHRKILLDHGVDINFPCASPNANNVVPLIRVIEAKPAVIPESLQHSVIEMPKYFLRENLLRQIS